MSKKRKVELCNIEDLPKPEINWDVCVLCQEVTNQPLITPTDTGYTSLATALQLFSERTRLPRHLEVNFTETNTDFLTAFLEKKSKIS